MRLASQALVSLNVTLCSPTAVNEFDIAGTDGRLFAGPVSDGRLMLQRGNREPEVLRFPRSAAAHMELVTKSCGLVSWRAIAHPRRGGGRGLEDHAPRLTLPVVSGATFGSREVTPDRTGLAADGCRFGE